MSWPALPVCSVAHTSTTPFSVDTSARGTQHQRTQRHRSGQARQRVTANAAAYDLCPWVAADAMLLSRFMQRGIRLSAWRARIPAPALGRWVVRHTRSSVVRRLPRGPSRKAVGRRSRWRARQLRRVRHGFVGAGGKFIHITLLRRKQLGCLGQQLGLTLGHARTQRRQVQR